MNSYQFSTTEVSPRWCGGRACKLAGHLQRAQTLT
jgi:hypothetical protein